MDDLNDDATSTVVDRDTLEQALYDLFESPHPRITGHLVQYHDQQSSPSEHPTHCNH